MPQLMYIVQFKGYAAPVGTTPHALQVITIASSCTMRAQSRRTSHETVWQVVTQKHIGFSLRL